MWTRHVTIAGLLVASLSITCRKQASIYSDGGASQRARPVANKGRATGPRAAQPPPLGRLPRHVIPKSYRLSLTVIPGKKGYGGEVEIALQLQKRVRTFWMHGRRLKVSSARLRVGKGSPLQATYTQKHKDGIVQIALPRAVGPGRARLTVKYRARFGRHLVGLHKVTERGKSYVFTDFEPSDARRAFPSFDDPGFKTPFDISLTVKSGHVAVANTRALREERLPGGMKRVVFARTAKLPTYLVAFAVGPFEVATVSAKPNAVRKKKLRLRVTALAGKGKQSAYALKQTPGILEELERYFGSPYPFDKLDLISIPAKGGAMENPGAITFSEILLLLDGARAPTWQRRTFAIVMAHELAHMWFGDLVTLRWWNDAWLNEAFATWLSYRTVERWRPALKAGLRFTERMLRAFRADSLAAARRIRQPIRSTHDIRNAFDGITYDKGGAVLGMFERYVGYERFQRGVRQYVARFRHENATGEDFLAALSSVGGKTIAGAFKTFLEQPGLPLVKVTSSCRDGRTQVTFHQSRYKPMGSSAPGKGLWQIPVCSRYARKGKIDSSCVLVRQREQRWTVPGAGCVDWLFPNAGGDGYYRFSVAPAGLKDLLEKALPRLSAEERLVLADSVAAAWVAGSIPFASMLKSLRPFASDRDPAAAQVLLRLLRFVRFELAAPGDRGKWRAYARKLFRPVLDKIGLKRQPADQQLKVLRTKLVGFLAFDADDLELRKKLAKWGRAYVGFGSDKKLHRDVVDSDIAESALIAAVKEGGAPVLEHLLALSKKVNLPLERARLRFAMARVTDPKLAKRVLALALEPALPLRDRIGLLRGQLGQLENRVSSWRWLRKNWGGLMKVLPPAAGVYIIRNLGNLCSDRYAREVAAFFRPMVERFPGAPRVLRATLERMSLCTALVKANRSAAKTSIN